MTPIKEVIKKGGKRNGGTLKPFGRRSLLTFLGGSFVRALMSGQMVWSA